MQNEKRRADDSKFWRLDGTITMGHILTTLSIVVAGVVWGLRLEGRVDGQDKIITMQEHVTDLKFNAMDKTLLQQKKQTEDDMSSIKRSLERIEDRLENKANKQ